MTLGARSHPAGGPVRRLWATPLPPGVGTAARVGGDNGPMDSPGSFRKTASPPAARYEAASLEWLRSADGAAVVPLLAAGPGWLETRRLRPAPPDRAAAAEFGRALARTHAAGAQWFGQGPPGLDPADSRLAEAPHPLMPSAAGAPTSWGAFFGEYRIAPYLRLARDRGALGAGGAGVVERLVARLTDGDLDAPQPGLCRVVARLHGDLWGGNVLWAADHHGRAGVTGVLIDPAAHGGHAETDLAELALFGSPHLEATLGAYAEVSALAPGWRERVPLHQVHMLAVHAALFGGGYGRQLVAAAARFV